MATASMAAVPFTTFVVKVASRCNLNCSYCYMYNLTDSTWRGQPGVMRPEVTEAFARQMAAHAISHNAPIVHVILHGGEPLLMGKARLADWVATVRRLTAGKVHVVFSVQSNGVLVDRGWITLLSDLNIRIGISVDGPKDLHDAHRRDHKNRGSYDRVLKAIRLLRSDATGRGIFSSVLAVVDTDLPPKTLFEFWQELDVPGFDLSLPHANHTHPPPKGRLSYGDWMIEFFDLWFEQNRHDRGVRYFENMIRCLFGYPVSTDNIGGRPVGVVVVETDGGIEPTDAFKCCEDGLTKAGFNVLTNAFSEVQGLAMIAALQSGAESLCSTCQGCEVLGVCGGGYMPHRYRKGFGFEQPSIYCEDLKKLIRHIRARCLEALPVDMIDQLTVEGRLAVA